VLRTTRFSDQVTYCNITISRSYSYEGDTLFIINYSGYYSTTLTNTGLLKMTVGVLTTCRTQYT